MYKKYKTALKNKILQKLCELGFANGIDGWFTPIKIDFDAQKNTFTVLFPHIFFASWFQNNVQKHFEQAALAIIEEENKEKVIFIYQNPQIYEPTATFLQNKKIVPPVKKFFKDFFYNAKNDFPLAAAQEVAKAEFPLKYNPFVIYGQSGAGKSLILRCIRKAFCSSKFKGKAFFDGAAENFYKKLQQTEVNDFFENNAFFMIHDMHALTLNNEEQNAITYFIELCTQKNKQIIFTSYKAPNREKKFSPSLRSRLSKGLVVELKNSDIDVRMRYAHEQSKKKNIKLSKEQLLIIAQRSENIPMVSGIILKIKAITDITPQNLETMDLENILQSFSGVDKNIQIDDIVSLCSQYFNIEKEHFFTNQRQAEFVFARQICMYLCREYLGLSYASIGKFLGGKDHSTVLHSIKKIKFLTDTNKDVYLSVTELKRKCSTL